MKIISKIPGIMFAVGLALMFPAEEAGFVKAIMQLFAGFMLMLGSVGLDEILEEKK